MTIIMTLWIGNGAVHKSSSQWQLIEFRKLNNSQWEALLKFSVIPLKRLFLTNGRT